MRKHISMMAASAVAALVMVGGYQALLLQGQTRQDTRVAAVPNEKGGQDMFGAYEPVVGWPKNLTTLPGHEKWTWGAGQGVFAETPNRVFILERGELPQIERPKTTKIAPSVEFPIGRLPWRDATSASPPGALFAKDGKSPGDDLDAGEPGVDYRWEHIINVVDAQGQPDRGLDALGQDVPSARTRSSRARTISARTSGSSTTIVTRFFRFSNDWQDAAADDRHSERARRADDKHFYRPDVHGVAAGRLVLRRGWLREHARRQVRQGRQVPDGLGRKGGAGQGDATQLLQQRARRGCRSADATRVRQRSWQSPYPGVRRQREVSRLVERGQGTRDIHLVYMDGSRYLWAFDRASSKMIKYDLNGNYMYSWGTWGNFPGGFWGVHGISVDSEGNVYVAEVDNAGAQKFRPRPGANPAFLITKPATQVRGTR
jgi:hypothetical protein